MILLRQISITFTLLLTNLVFTYAGGPWTQSKKGLYLQVGYNLIAENNRLFSTANEDLYLYRAITDQTIGIYAEYGITDKLTLTASLPYKMTKNSEKIFLPNDPFPSAHGKLDGTGNVIATLKYQLAHQKYKIATSIDVTLPTASKDLNTRLSTGYEGYGFQPNLFIGKSKDRWYGYSSIGYNFRTKMTNEVRFNLETGYKVYKNMYAIIAFDIVQPIEQLRPRTNNFLYLYQDQQQYYASTLKYSSRIWKNIGINLHMTIITIHANYVQKGPALGGSIYWKI